MKPRPTLAAGLFAIMAVFSLNAGAAADTTADAKTEEAALPMEKAVPPMEKAAHQKKMRPHSHVEEKTGVPQKAPAAMADKPNAAKDKTKHFHPRDGK